MSKKGPLEFDWKEITKSALINCYKTPREEAERIVSLLGIVR